MSNFPQLPGYPYGLKDPFPSDAANQASESLEKTVNAADGSSHAPTDMIAWSGASGGGFEFSDAFGLSGDADVSAGLTLDAPVSGSVIFGKLVAVDMRGPLSFKASPGGAPGSAAWESGASATWQSGSTLTLASGSTFNLSSAGYVRGQLTIKASGGPGNLTQEVGTTMNFNGAIVVGNAATITYTSGAEVNGLITRKGTEVRDGTTARTAHRAVVQLTDADADLTVDADRYDCPATQAANRTYKLRHTGTAPKEGERIKVTRIFETAPPAHSVSVIREDGTVLMKFANSRAGDAEFEFASGRWVPIHGYQTLVGTSGIYDDTWV